MIKARIRNITKKGTNKILNLLPINKGTEGLPAEISFAALNRLCLSCLDDPLKKAFYTHLSGWKSSNTYRLNLVCERGSKWSLIFKNAVYGEEEIPALSGFPLIPGKAEYALYSSPVLTIKDYLPEIYDCSEVSEGVKYFYLIEDLSGKYRLANKRSDIYTATTVLSDIYNNSNEILLKISNGMLPRYDNNFSSGLKDYILVNLEKYQNVAGDKQIAEICRLWSKIEKIYERKNSYTTLFSFIHGDPNLSNIMVSKQDDNHLKLIDWEWAGIGLPHQDLASLLKRAAPSTELESLQIFSKTNKLLKFREHKELYEICQIERGLIDASFLAAQKINSSNSTKMNVDEYIIKSASRVLSAYDRLT